LAVREALAVGVPTVAIVDTNADPFLIDYPIPANDDAVGSIKLIVSYIMDAWVEGVKAQKPPKTEEPKTEKPTPAPSDAKAMDGEKASKVSKKTKVQKTVEKKEAAKKTRKLSEAKSSSAVTKSSKKK
jgi:small subunit ribosomal protein S2